MPVEINQLSRKPRVDARFMSLTVSIDNEVNDISRQPRDDRFFSSVTVYTSEEFPYVLPRTDAHFHSLTVGE